VLLSKTSYLEQRKYLQERSVAAVNLIKERKIASSAGCTTSDDRLVNIVTSLRITDSRRYTTQQRPWNEMKWKCN